MSSLKLSSYLSSWINKVDPIFVDSNQKIFREVRFCSLLKGKAIQLGSPNKPHKAHTQKLGALPSLLEQNSGWNGIKRLEVFLRLPVWDACLSQVSNLLHLHGMCQVSCSYSYSCVSKLLFSNSWSDGMSLSTNVLTTIIPLTHHRCTPVQQHWHKPSEIGSFRLRDSTQSFSAGHLREDTLK